MTNPDQTPDTLRFGLVGCGDIGQLRAAAVSSAPGCRLTAVADLDPVRARALAARFGAAAEPDWHTLVLRPDVDAVIVSTPPVSHVEIGVAALEAGKDVLCEKPLARRAEEGRVLLAAAERMGRRVATGFNYRFYPSFKLARQLLADGTIGELDHIRSYGGYSATAHNQAWVHDAGTVGGGALHDIGIHLIDLTRDFLGDVCAVTGVATGAVWKYKGCEDNGFALLRSREGKTATLHASWTAWDRYRFRVDLYGSRGCILAGCFPMITRVVWAAEIGGATRRRVHLFPRTLVGEKLKSYRWVVVRSFIEEFAAFRSYVRGEPSRIGTGFDGLRALEIAEAAAHGATRW